MDAVQRFQNDLSKGEKKGCFSLVNGAPGTDMLKPCQQILKKATEHLLDDDLDVDRGLGYGPNQGDEEFRDNLAHFLTQQYGDPVPLKSENLIVTAGATQGVHLLTTMLFGRGSICFIEDPTYFAMHKVLKKDLGLNALPVKTNKDGIDVEDLDRLLTQHRPADLPKDQPYWSFVYTVPVYNNPIGNSYTPARCEALVKCARKHGVLILAEDVYNLISFNSSSPPARLITYDNPSDKDYYGNVVSNGTFSKILMPGIRVGWIEAPKIITDIIVPSALAFSGGSFNHFGSLIVNSLLKLKLLEPHIKWLQQAYGRRMKMVCDILKQVPEIQFEPVQGGFFLWLELPEYFNTSDLLSEGVENYNVMFIPGACTSPTGGFVNCVRVAISKESDENIQKATEAFVRLVQDTITKHKQ